AHNATFSSDFEKTFVTQRCCLLVFSDHGNEMIRQINLKEEDWLEISHTSLGSYSLWSVGIVLSCFLGLALLALTSFVMKKRITTTRFIMTWKLLLIIKLGEQVRTFFSYVRNLVAGSLLSRLVMMIVSHLSLMYSAISRL
ncbi:unnamed protein product, partial [Brassica oleracea]